MVRPGRRAVASGPVSVVVPQSEHQGRDVEVPRTSVVDELGQCPPRAAGLRSARRVERLRAEAAAARPRARKLWFALSHPQVLLTLASNPSFRAQSAPASLGARLFAERAWRKLVRMSRRLPAAAQIPGDAGLGAWVDALCALAGDRPERLVRAGRCIGDELCACATSASVFSKLIAEFEEVSLPLRSYGALLDACTEHRGPGAIGLADVVRRLLRRDDPALRLLATASTRIATERGRAPIAQARLAVLGRPSNLTTMVDRLEALPAPVLEVAAGLVTQWDRDLQALITAAEGLVA